ncbi:efflux RND transporter periplasmic adaptor subunit [Methylobacterium gnaphalii]|uniref:Hemolysin D n=1 Tax=Methylobacterium gnaphalii TaxID=1010610 RepID=A0A512JQ39_9HYPH|nr:efflux RND transporter periplasmic adaptor subunit [Methylobacterium gnaphalii]GEP12075.1 hemolysin D [Methylobacterium gnaphalii]GJD70724.1 Multidrug resistance protein MdtA [Methylobacterium gnaphalii]GLS48666.1 hemolysin D [Methylobacterium gnaphalii]
MSDMMDCNVHGPTEAARRAIETDPLGTDHANAAQAHQDVPPPRKLPFAVAVLALGGLMGLGGWHHWGEVRAAEETQAEAVEFIPQVRTIAASRDDTPMQLTLPGQTEAFDKADIFARATGYIAERKVDIGSRVKKGDLLVRIAAPDLDEQLHQSQAQLGQMKAQVVEAKANVDQAKADVTLASVTDTRTSTLAGQGWASKQTADTSRAKVLTANATLNAAEARVKVAEANLAAQQATVDRLTALTGFENVTAPFDGIITERKVDVGDLVHADTGSSTSLFSIESEAVLRVAVQIPQYAAIGIHDGVAASIAVPQMPGKTFSGTVSRSSVALKSSARTLTTEVDVSNPNGVLRPGLYVAVRFDIPRNQPSVVIPSEALVFDANGTRVAVVEPGDTVKLEPVEIARDLGTTLELRKGLNGGETLVLSPPADLQDGSRVAVAHPAAIRPVAAVEAKAE